MNTLEEILQKQNDAMKRIELFLDIQSCKALVSEDVQDLRACARVASERLHRSKEYITMENGFKEMSSSFTSVMRKMRRNEILMLHLLEVGTFNNPQVESNQHAHPKPEPLKEVQSEIPSKMYLSDYSKSPFTVRSKPSNLKFYDFDADITEEQFEAIPKYLKGRMQISELSQFLQTDIIKCFEEKYSLMYKQRKAVLNQHDLQIWKEYNYLQTKFPDHSFITQDDLSRKTGKVLDKKSSAKLQMLRHLHILQEVRLEGTIYYLWVYSK